MYSPLIPLQSIDENFVRCSVCQNLFKEPKVLGCLHRYCKVCLDEILDEGTDVFQCPMCKQSFTVPEGGSEAVKSDFYMRSVLEFMELQKSFKSGETKNCVGCKTEKEVTAYCFKCGDFLCGQCHDFHINNEMVKDHRQHILDLKDAAGTLSLENLASLREVPRCHQHVENSAQLCCCSCDNVPVCVACTFGQHKGHDLNEVSTLAETERGKLKEKLAEIEAYKDDLYQIRRSIEDAQEELEASIVRKKESLKSEYEGEATKIREETQRNDEELVLHISETEKDVEGQCQQLETEMEEEIQKIREIYNNKMEDVKATGAKTIEQLREDHKVKGSKLSEQTGILDEQSEELCSSVDDQMRGKKDEIQRMSEMSERLIKRYEAFVASAAGILASRDDWTDVQCLPDISSASEPLGPDLASMEVPAVASVSDITVDSLSSLRVDKITVTEDAERVVEMGGGTVYSMEGCEGGKIVLAKKGSISVIDVDGGIVHTEESGGRNYCASISPYTVAMATSSPNRIGIFDVRDFSYKSKLMSEALEGNGNHGNSDYELYSIAYDDQNRQILVGTFGKKDVLVFSEELGYHHTVTLPENIDWPGDMAVHGDKLIVCDTSGECAYMLKMGGADICLEHEFAKPADATSPYTVCTDKYGFIYMVWGSTDGRLLAQYSQDGNQLLATRPVDRDAWCVTTMETTGGLKLLVATERSGHIFIYGLET